MKSLDAFDFCCADQRAIEAVGPSVIGTAKELARAAAFGSGPGTVAANVIEAAQFFVSAARYKQRLSDKFSREVVPGICNLARMPDDLPGTGEDPFFLDRKYLGISVERCGESPGFGDVGVDAKTRFGNSRLLGIH